MIPEPFDWLAKKSKNHKNLTAIWVSGKNWAKISNFSESQKISQQKLGNFLEKKNTEKHKKNAKRNFCQNKKMQKNAKKTTTCLRLPPAPQRHQFDSSPSLLLVGTPPRLPHRRSLGAYSLVPFFSRIFNFLEAPMTCSPQLHAPGRGSDVGASSACPGRQLSGKIQPVLCLGFSIPLIRTANTTLSL